MPDAEEAAKDNELTEMIRGVVGDKKRFAEKILSVAPTEGLEEIGLWPGDESFELLKIGANGGDRSIPGVRRGWRGRLGPVLFGPFEWMVAAGGRGGKVEDVALGDAEVFEELPGGVRQIGRDGGAVLGGKVFDGVVEGDVSLASAKEVDDLFAELGLVGVLRFAHAGSPPHWMQAEAVRVTRLSGDFVFLCHGCREVALAPHAEVTADEGFEIAVEDLVHVANFDTGTEVLGHAVGLQDVAADLRAELDVELGVFELAADLFLLVELVLVEARAEEFHRLLFVLVLGALVLTAGDEACWKVGDADGGVGGVDVLAALAAGAVGVDAQVFGLDVDDDGVVDLGRDEDRGETGVAALGRVEGRDADEAMDAGFSTEETEGEVAGDREGGGLDSGLVAVLDFVYLNLEVLALAPADVHAHEHLGPVLGLGAACAGVHDDDGVERVGLFREHSLRFELVGEVDQGGDLASKVGLSVFPLFGEFEVGLDVVGAAGKFGIVGEEGLDALALAHERLRTCGVGPDGWVGGFFFDDG